MTRPARTVAAALKEHERFNFAVWETPSPTRPHAIAKSDQSYYHRPSYIASPKLTMSRKTAIIEEFDDDTDLPLPHQPLPNTGAHGPLLEEITSDDDLEPSHRAGPASPASQSFFRGPQFARDGRQPANNITDVTPYKTCVTGFN